MPSSRPKVKDPVQEKLRIHKKEWNAAYKAFSMRLKGYKDALNGKGNARVGLRPTDIKDAFEGQTSSLLSQLSQEFSALVEGANEITREQADYSQHRRKKQPKKAPGVQPPAIPDAAVPSPAAEALSRLGSQLNNAGIQKTAIWGTLALGIGGAYALRLLMKTFSRSEQSRFRIGMRRNAIELNDALLDLENAILSLSDHSIPDAMRKFQSAQYNFDSLMQTFDYIDASLKEEAKKTPPTPNEKPAKKLAPSKLQPSETHENSNDPVAAIEDALHILLNLQGVSLDSITRLHKTIIEYKKEDDAGTKSLLLDTIQNAYEQIIDASMPAIEAKFGNINAHDPAVLTSARPVPRRAQNAPSHPAPKQEEPDDISLPNDEEQEEKDALAQFNGSEELVKTAHNMMTRFLKRQLLKASPFNKTVPHRIKAVEIIDAGKKEVEAVVKALKHSIEPVELGKSLLAINNMLTEVGKVLGILGIVYKRDVYNGSKKKEHTWNDPDFIFNQRIKKDLSGGYR